mmetsp:Transcript_14712/g.30019  ORF Transcript_14712/g.30019 Transcript_14712/m.30019 type:complete len:294 (+) Transcript_14712:214-1095(+)
MSALSAPPSLGAFLLSRSPPTPSSTWIREMTKDVAAYSGVYNTVLKGKGGKEVKVAIEEDYSSISKRVWDCSVLMSHQLLHCHLNPSPLSLASRSVLDVGSGCGLLPICLSKFGQLGAKECGHLVATEYQDGILEHLGGNVAANGGGVEVRHLDWFDPKSVFDAAAEVDTVMMSDCTLDPSESPAIVTAFEEIVVASWKGKAAAAESSGRRTDVLVGVCVERAGTASFLSLARERFLVTKLESFHPEYRPELNGKERYAVYHMALSKKVLRERLGEEVTPEGEYSLEGYELLD